MSTSYRSVLTAIALLLSASGAAFGAEAVAKPTPLRTPPPDYPAALRQQNVTGLVVVRIHVDEKGKVSDAEVVKSNEKRLETLALQAVKGWSFKPATKDGLIVASQLTVPIQFSLDS